MALNRRGWPNFAAVESAVAGRGQDADAAKQPAIEGHDDRLSSQYGQRCIGNEWRKHPNVAVRQQGGMSHDF